MAAPGMPVTPDLASTTSPSIPVYEGALREEGPSEQHTQQNPQDKFRKYAEDELRYEEKKAAIRFRANAYRVQDELRTHITERDRTIDNLRFQIDQYKISQGNLSTSVIRDDILASKDREIEALKGRVSDLQSQLTFAANIQSTVSSTLKGKDTEINGLKSEVADLQSRVCIDRTGAEPMYQSSNVDQQNNVAQDIMEDDIVFAPTHAKCKRELDLSNISHEKIVSDLKLDHQRHSQQLYEELDDKKKEIESLKYRLSVTNKELNAEQLEQIGDFVESNGTLDDYKPLLGPNKYQGLFNEYENVADDNDTARLKIEVMQKELSKEQMARVNKFLSTDLRVIEYVPFSGRTQDTSVAGTTIKPTHAASTPVDLD